MLGIMLDAKRDLIMLKSIIMLTKLNYAVQVPAQSCYSCPASMHAVHSTHRVVVCMSLPLAQAVYRRPVVCLSSQALGSMMPGAVVSSTAAQHSRPGLHCCSAFWL